MMARGSGHLVFVSSLSGKAASPGGSVYSATKFGLRGFALALRQDLRPHGVGVSVVVARLRPRRRACSTTRARSCRRTSGTSTPEQVADGVVRAIERNRAEVEVAPLAGWGRAAPPRARRRALGSRACARPAARCAGGGSAAIGMRRRARRQPSVTKR